MVLDLHGVVSDHRDAWEVVRRADHALRAAARDLGAALEVPTTMPAAAAAAADAGAPAAAGTQTLISEIERSLMEAQVASNVAMVSILQVMTPKQYATMWAARHPRVITSAAMLRSAWLLLLRRERQQEE